MKLTTLTLAALTGLAMLSSSAHAVSIVLTQTGSAYQLGTAVPGTPSGEAAERSRLVELIASFNEGDPNGTVVSTPPTLTLSFGAQTALQTSLPTLVDGNGVKTEGIQNDSDFVFVAGYEYLMAKFSNSSTYYYIGNLNLLPGDTVTISSPDDSLSHYTYFNAQVTSVPDGGATVMLLGLALGGIGAARRYFGK
jgi:hypothetical protein